MAERRRRAKRVEKDEERSRIKFGSEAALGESFDSSIENNVSAGAFQGCFTVKFERNVAFQIVRIAFTLSDARRL